MSQPEVTSHQPEYDDAYFNGYKNESDHEEKKAESADQEDKDHRRHSSSNHFSPQHSDNEKELHEDSEKESSATVCWGCTSGYLDSSLMVYHKYLKMASVYKDGVGVLDRDLLTGALSAFFETEIRHKVNECLLPGQKEIPHWKPDDIYKHFRYHVKDGNLDIEDTGTSLKRRASKRGEVITAVERALKSVRRTVVYCLVQVRSSTDDEDTEDYLIPREELEKDQDLLNMLEECNGHMYHELRDEPGKDSLYLMDTIESVHNQLKSKYSHKVVAFDDKRDLLRVQRPEKKLIDEWFRFGI